MTDDQAKRMAQLSAELGRLSKQLAAVPNAAQQVLMIERCTGEEAVSASKLALSVACATEPDPGPLVLDVLVFAVRIAALLSGNKGTSVPESMRALADAFDEAEKSLLEGLSDDIEKLKRLLPGSSGGNN